MAPSSTAPDSLFVGSGKRPANLILSYANRHGLIAGATGAGKTVSLQVLAEAFSARGVPVFLADVKDDLSGVSQCGTPNPKLDERARAIGLADYILHSSPTVFWDLYGEKGHPIRTTISEMGPLLLSRLLGLNETQEGVLNVMFEIADEEGLLLLDLKDLRSLLHFAGQNAAQLTTRHGNVSKASVGAIQRRLLTLENEGGEYFFGEPAFDLDSFLETDREGRGYIKVLAADRLMQSPRLYATFLLWLLAELFEALPEVGDGDKPKLVFFFDEAHLLFDDAPKALVDKVEQVVRLIRSKGVGVYFVSQSPLDIPEDILGQLGNRIQHALRAFTPKDRKTVRAVADNFRQNPEFNAAEAIQDLGVGEALVSLLEEKGRPGVVERTLIRPPASMMGPATQAERRRVIEASPFYGSYEDLVDRESAYEVLAARASQSAEAALSEATEKEQNKSGRKRQTMVEAGIQSMVRTIGRAVGRELVRGVLGSFFRRR